MIKIIENDKVIYSSEYTELSLTILNAVLVHFTIKEESTGLKRK